MTAKIPTRSDVTSVNTFIDWAKATVGVPHPTVQDRKILGKKTSELFADNPGTDWQTIVDVVLWCKDRKRRMGRVWQYVDQYRWAYQAGAIDIPLMVDESLEERFDKAISEADPAWRRRLRMAVGDERERVLAEWERNH